MLLVPQTESETRPQPETLWQLVRSVAERLSLSQRFAITGSAVMLIGMFVIGSWVTGKIQANVIENTAQATALFMDSFISPLAQELEGNDTLSVGPIRALDEMLASAALQNRVISIKIWKKSGLLGYSNNVELIGRRFEPTDSLRKAWAGSVVAEFDDLASEENQLDRQAGVPLLEIYSPIREAWSGKIIAVAEFYEDASTLKDSLQEARLQSWLVVGIVTLVMALSLFGIVHGGSVLIERQKAVLQNRMVETSRVSEQNRQLRQRVERASGRISELNEQFLRRISAELHDGPAQLVSLAALRLDSLRRDGDRQARDGEINVIHKALGEAMRDIRNICNGLSLPEIETQDLHESLLRIVQSHEQRTQTDVESVIAPSLATIPHAVKICAYRFVQEGLNNAFRHAGGVGQKVEYSVVDQVLRVAVFDAGAEAAAATAGSHGVGLGLAGLRERVESLGGTFSFDQAPGKGSRLAMTVSLKGERCSG
jgi:signal transduction histidine kinase